MSNYSPDCVCFQRTMAAGKPPPHPHKGSCMIQTNGMEHHQLSLSALFQAQKFSSEEILLATCSNLFIQLLIVTETA